MGLDRISFRSEGAARFQVAGWTYWITWTGGLALLGLTGFERDGADNGPDFVEFGDLL
jgi:hypothetical protein